MLGDFYQLILNPRLASRYTELPLSHCRLTHLQMDAFKASLISVMLPRFVISMFRGMWWSVREADYIQGSSKEVLIGLMEYIAVFAGSHRYSCAVSVSELVDVSQRGFNGCVVIVVLLGMMLQVRSL